MSKMHLNPAHKGRLHAHLHIPAGQTIPTARLESAKHSPNPAIRKEASFALAAKHFEHHGPGHTHAAHYAGRPGEGPAQTHGTLERQAYHGFGRK